MQPSSSVRPVEMVAIQSELISARPKVGSQKRTCSGVYQSRSQSTVS